MNEFKNCKDCIYLDYTHHVGRPVCTFGGKCKDGKLQSVTKGSKEMYKIETFIPAENLEELRAVLLKVDAGHIGNYRGCITTTPVTGMWYSDEGSNPTIGTPFQWSKEDELKIEVNVANENVVETVKAIREVHPYEEPVINVIKLERINM